MYVCGFGHPVLGAVLVKFTNILSDIFQHGSTSLTTIVLSPKLRCRVAHSLRVPF